VLVSDDEQLRSLLCGLLAAHGYSGVSSSDSAGALMGERSRAAWDVAIVDLSVPSAGALRVLARLKTTSAATVVIGANKNGMAAHELQAQGAVLVAKPFDPRELLLIIRGMLDDGGGFETRSGSEFSAGVSAGPVTLTPLLNAALVASREIELTGVETRILHELLIHAAQPVTRERLTRRGLLRDWSPGDRALDTHINRLRRKVGNDERGRTPIRTITGVGYLLVADWTPGKPDY
jgi:two-component system response regulator CpxR